MNDPVLFIILYIFLFLFITVLLRSIDTSPVPVHSSPAPASAYWWMITIKNFKSIGFLFCQRKMCEYSIDASILYHANSLAFVNVCIIFAPLCWGNFAAKRESVEIVTTRNAHCRFTLPFRSLFALLLLVWIGQWNL